MKPPPAPDSALLFTLAPGGTGAPLFLVPSVGATPLSLVRLARAIVPRRPVHAFAYLGIEDDAPPHESFAAMAHAYVAEIVTRSPHGPYFLGGHCLGGAVALEIALELESRGATVARLVVLDSIAPPVAGDELPYVDGSPEKLGEAARQLRRILEDVIERTVSASPMLESDTYRRLGEVLRVHTEAAFAYRARPLRASLHVLRTEAMHDVVLENWSRIATAGIARHRVPGDTFSMLRPPHVEAVGRSLGRALEDLA